MLLLSITPNLNGVEPIGCRYPYMTMKFIVVGMDCR